MKFFFTVDVETYTGDYEFDVHGYGKGLDYLVEQLDLFQIKATFFVEALGATRWGVEPLQKVCSLINRSGHDIQLHIHPVVMKNKGIDIIDDKLWKYDHGIQKYLIETGLGNLHACGVHKVCSFRAGDLAAGKNTLKIMQELGLHISSNRDQDIKSSIQSQLNEYFPVINDVSKKENIVDLPVTSFKSPIPFWDGRYRHLEISAMSAREMIDGLTKMEKAGYSCATLLTHPGEFFRRSGNRIIFKKKNCRRLNGLLKFLSERPDMVTAPMNSETLSDIAFPLESPPEIKLNVFYSLARLFSQAYDRMLIKMGK